MRKGDVADLSVVVTLSPDTQLIYATKLLSGFGRGDEKYQEPFLRQKMTESLPVCK